MKPLELKKSIQKRNFSPLTFLILTSIFFMVKKVLLRILSIQLKPFP